MAASIALVFLALAGTCLADCDTLNPNILSTCDVPGLTVTSWSRAVVINNTSCNVVVDKDEFIDQPEVRYPTALEDATYTLIMIDPDVPGFGDGEYWLHWIVSNIPGADFATGDLDMSTEVAGYNKPDPPPESGAHRYMFMAYEQTAPSVRLSDISQRPHFRLDNWLEQAEQREALCKLVAGQQFRAPF